MSVAWRPARRSPIALRDSGELYQTPIGCTEALVLSGEIGRLAGAGVVWEPASGKGAVVHVLKAAGLRVYATDLTVYPGADSGILAPVDFLAERSAPAGVSVICTNPPGRLADRFVRQGLELGVPVVAFLRWQAAEGAGRVRSDIMDWYCRRAWLGRQRPEMMHRKDWKGPRQKRAGLPYAWFVFEPFPCDAGFVVKRINWSLS